MLDERPIDMAISAIYFAIRIIKHQRKIFSDNIFAESSIEEKELGENIIFIISKSENKLLSEFGATEADKYIIQLSNYIDERSLKESIKSSVKKNFLQIWRNESIHQYESRNYIRRFKPTVFVSSSLQNQNPYKNVTDFLKQLKVDIISSSYYWGSDLKINSLIEISSLSDLAIFIFSDYSEKLNNNQIFELGYLLGKLGRENVIIFADNNFNLPSDLKGLKIINSNSGDWQYELAVQIDLAGINFEKSNLKR